MVDEDDDIARSVSKYGWASIDVDDSGRSPRFVYTLGLGHSFGHPEVIVFGVDGQLAHGVISDMVEGIKKGHAYGPGLRYPGVLEGFDIAVGPVHPTQHLLYFGYAIWFYRRMSRPDLLKAVQVFWPDKAGNFPSDLKCDSRVAQLQPRLSLPVPPSELRAFMDEFGSR